MDDMFVDINNESYSNSDTLSLQEAFLKFQKAKQIEMKSRNDGDEGAQQSTASDRDDEERMIELRKKFLERCLKYIGVPYKKKYHQPGSKEYKSNIFLDCCGLVRRVLLDLRKDFGFRIGPWNQAYMFDTLPHEVGREEDMKPGDLVFISGIYFNKTMRHQPHNMVHVEVWMGDGPKTVGARWHKGLVQVFDSYQFESTSYHSMTYHFRSIDTWLKGTCKSFCKRHPWKRKRRALSKKSVFTHNLSPHNRVAAKRRTSPPSPKTQSSESSSGLSNEESDSSRRSEAVDASEEECEQATYSGEMNSLSPNTRRSKRASPAEEFTNEVYSEYDDFKISQSMKELDLVKSPPYEWSDSFQKAVELIAAPQDPSPTFLPPLSSANQSQPSSKKSFYVFTNRPISSLDRSDEAANNLNESENV